MFKIGISINKSKMTEQFFDECAKCGVNCIELSPSAADNEGLDFSGISAAIRSRDIEVWSYHLPFLPFEELDISRPELAKHSVEYLSGLIRRAADAGIRNYVIHSSGEPIDEGDRPIRMKTAKESLYKLAEVAAEGGGRLLVENLPRTVLGKSSNEMLELLSAHPSLVAVFDTNHLLGEDSVHFIKALGNRIVSTHVSDYDFIDERHLLPGEGKADFYAMAKALHDVGYEGPWLYEIAFGNTKNITRSRTLNAYDIVTNAKEIFESKPLTVIK